MSHFAIIVIGFFGWIVLSGIYISLGRSLDETRRDRDHHKQKWLEMNEENQNLYTQKNSLEKQLNELKSTFEKAKKCIGL